MVRRPARSEHVSSSRHEANSLPNHPSSRYPEGYRSCEAISRSGTQADCRTPFRIFGTGNIPAAGARNDESRVTARHEAVSRLVLKAGCRAPVVFNPRGRFVTGRGRGI